MVFLGDTVIQVCFSVMRVLCDMLNLIFSGVGEKRYDAETAIEGPTVLYSTEL